MNYEKDMRIDESSLDIEWLDQPILMLKYARLSADARKAFDQAKEKLDVVKAEIDMVIRNNPADYGIEKVTEAAVNAAIVTHPRWRKANEDLINAKYEADMAQGAVRAFEARKDALENLVRLHGQQYFAGPKVPRDISWERTERQKLMDAGVNEKLNPQRTRKT